MKMRLRRVGQDVIRGAVLLLVVCLVADMAMPLLPGAFRLDPSESIAAAGRGATTAVATPDVSLVRSLRNSLGRDDALRVRRTMGSVALGRHIPLIHPRPLPAFAQNDAANASDDD
jgi:hypothetical protein